MRLAIELIWWIGLVGALVPTLVILKEAFLVVAPYPPPCRSDTRGGEGYRRAHASGGAATGSGRDRAAPR